MAISCPADNTELVLQSQDGVGAMNCAKCKGCWLRPGDARNAFSRLGGTESHWERFYERVNDTGRETPHKCPDCGAALRAISHRNVEVDACTTCHGIWFDGGELRQFLEQKAGRSMAPAAIAGAAGIAALGVAGMAAAGAGEQQNPDQQGSTLGNVVDAVDVVDTLSGGEAVGGVLSFIGDLLGSL